MLLFHVKEVYFSRISWVRIELSITAACFLVVLRAYYH